jgi:Tol biopolymer transport system component
VLSSSAAVSVRPRSVPFALVTTLATIALLLAGCGGDAATSTPSPDPNADRLEIVYAFAPGASGTNEPMELFQISKDGRVAKSLFGTAGPDYFPEWSRDGSQLLFNRVSASPNGVTGAIWIANADGTGAHKLAVDTISAPDAVNYQVHAAWSPDGASIVFRRVIGNVGSGLAIINADGTGLRWLGQEGDTPSWSINGRIAFSKDRALWTINPDGSGLLKIPSLDGDMVPKWSRDGTRLLFMHIHDEIDGTPYDVVVSRGDGSDRRILVTGKETYALTWSPDGQYVLYEHGELGDLTAPKCFLHKIPSAGGPDVNLTPSRGVGACAGASWRSF